MSKIGCEVFLEASYDVGEGAGQLIQGGLQIFAVLPLKETLFQGKLLYLLQLPEYWFIREDGGVELHYFDVVGRSEAEKCFLRRSFGKLQADDRRVLCQKVLVFSSKLPELSPLGLPLDRLQTDV